MENRHLDPFIVDIHYVSKEFALKPRKKKSSHQRCEGEKLKTLTVMNANAKCSQKKRKYDSYMNHDSYMNGDKLATTLPGEKYGDQDAIINDTVEYWSICRKSYSSDSDRLNEGQNLMKQENFKNHLQDLVTNSVKSSIKGKSISKISKASESSFHEVFDDFGEIKHLLNSKIDGMEHSQPQNFISYKDNHIPRAAIPIGPKFQVEVPKWKSAENVRYHSNDEDLKWLGIQVWPMPNIFKNNGNCIEDGRPDSCLCECPGSIPGSIDCVKLHVSEARERLKLEIGTTFSSWKFDEMGEDVSMSWTLDEQKEFESLVKLYPLSRDTKFWKHAMEHFSSKSLKCMVNYYHNVYIPRRLGLETRSSFGSVDSDDDQDVDLQI